MIGSFQDSSSPSPQPLSRKFSKNSFASSTGDEEDDEDFDDLDDLPDEDDDNPSVRNRMPSESPLPSRRGSKLYKKRPPTLAGIGHQDSISSDNASLGGKSERLMGSHLS